MKKIFQIIKISAGLVLFYIILILFIEFFYILEPSKGKKIDTSKDTNAAILVIDVQNKLTFTVNPRKAVKYEVGAFLTNINTVLDRLSPLEVIYIRQEFPKNSFLSFVLPTFPEESEPGTAINSSVYRGKSKIFTKSQADAFTNPALQRYLESRNIGTLYITGLAAEACVNSTIAGAAMKGYRVIVVREAVLSMFGGIPDRELVDKYRAKGAEIISVKDLK